MCNIMVKNVQSGIVSILGGPGEKSFVKICIIPNIPKEHRSGIVPNNIANFPYPL